MCQMSYLNQHPQQPYEVRDEKIEAQDHVAGKWMVGGSPAFETICVQFSSSNPKSKLTLILNWIL